MGLRTNTTKTEAMIYIPGKIRTALSHEAYANRIEGHEDWRAWQMRSKLRHLRGGVEHRLTATTPGVATQRLHRLRRAITPTGGCTPSSAL